MKTFVACLFVSFPLFAQDDASSTYRLQVRMVEAGARDSPESQTYTLLLQSGSRGKVNASRRIPNYTSTNGEAKELHTVSLGSIIECRAAEAAPGVSLDCAFESSYVEPGQPERVSPPGFLPVMNSRQVETRAVVPLGREVQFAQLDDPTSGNRLEIFVTAERAMR